MSPWWMNSFFFFVWINSFIIQWCRVAIHDAMVLVRSVQSRCNNVHLSRLNFLFVPISRFICELCCCLYWFAVIRVSSGLKKMYLLKRVVPSFLLYLWQVTVPRIHISGKFRISRFKSEFVGSTDLVSESSFIVSRYLELGCPYRYCINAGIRI